MAAMEFVARQFRSAARVEHAIRRIDQPDGQHQQRRRHCGHFHMEAPGKQNLPQHRHNGRIQAKQIRPKPEPGRVRRSQDPLCFSGRRRIRPCFGRREYPGIHRFLWSRSTPTCRRSSCRNRFAAGGPRIRVFKDVDSFSVSTRLRIQDLKIAYVAPSTLGLCASVPGSDHVCVSFIAEHADGSSGQHEIPAGLRLQFQPSCG